MYFVRPLIPAAPLRRIPGPPSHNFRDFYHLGFRISSTRVPSRELSSRSPAEMFTLPLIGPSTPLGLQGCSYVARFAFCLSASCGSALIQFGANRFVVVALGSSYALLARSRDRATGRRGHRHGHELTGEGCGRRPLSRAFRRARGKSRRRT